METALRLLTSTGGYRRSLFMLDDSFEHFHFLPSNGQGETLLKLLVKPEMMAALDRLLLSNQENLKGDIPFEHDAVASNETPTLLAYDFDMQRICRFNKGLDVYGMSGGGWLSWNPWARGWLTQLVWASRPGKGLATAAEAAPGKGLARGTCFFPLLFVVLALALLLLSWVLVLPWLTSPVLLGAAVGAAPTVRAQVKGYKGAPLLLYTDN